MRSSQCELRLPVDTFNGKLVVIPGNLTVSARNCLVSTFSYNITARKVKSYCYRWQNDQLKMPLSICICFEILKCI